MRIPLLLRRSWLIGLGLIASAGTTPSIQPVHTLVMPKTSLAVSQKVHPITIKRIDPGRLKIVVPKPGKVPSPEGPDLTARLDLADIVEDPAALSALDSVVGWDVHRIVQDKKAPNYFYHIPSRMLLQYDEEGYGLYVQYNASNNADDPSVLLTARLAAPYRNGDIQLLKEILRNSLKLPSAVALHIQAIQPLQIDVDLNTISAGLSLPKERIGVQLPSSLRDTMTLTLRLTPDETEEVLALLSGAGLSGNLVVKLEEGSLNIPFLLRYTEFAGEAIPEIIAWGEGKRIDTITNISPFPITLQSVNGYLKTPSGPSVVSKPLKKSSALAPGKSRAFKLPTVERLFGHKPLMVWFGMAIDTGCTPCLAKIDEEIRAGIALNPLETLSFEAIPTVFEKYGIYKIRLKIKTPYFTQKANKIALKEIELTQQNNRNDSLRIYMPKTDSTKEPLLFKYKMVLILQDGEQVEGAWHKWRDTALYIGSKQLEPLLKGE